MYTFIYSHHRKGSSVGHLISRPRFHSSLLSDDRKPNDFQHSARLTKSCNIPCSQSVMKWSQSLLLGEKKVVYLNDIWQQMFSKQFVNNMSYCYVWGDLFIFVEGLDCVLVCEREKDGSILVFVQSRWLGFYFQFLY